MLFKNTVGFLCLMLSFSLQASAVEINLLGKLDDAQEYVSDPLKGVVAKYTIIEMMAKCEFDEQCELNMKPQLEQLAKEQKNILYSAFLKYLEWSKKDLAFNIKHCQIDEKKIVRKVYAKCYLDWVEAEKKHPPLNRHEIDILETNRNKCLRENELALANAGNIFAQADLVNLAEYFKDTAEMNKWSAKIEAIKNTPQYQLFIKCSEIP